MFSIPYVVGVALVTGGCCPAAFDESRRADPAVRRLVDLTRVVGTEEFDRRLPEERAARVTLKLRGGATLVAEVPNPVGDVAHRPFGLREIRDKLDGLLERGTGEDLEALARNLLGCKNVNDVLGDSQGGRSL
jgi:2-methylcitrate dehydratase PrpD